MTYTDPDTGIEYEKSVTDFLTDGNVKGEWRGNVWISNSDFDQELWDREWAEWEQYKKDNTPADNDDHSDDVEGYFGSNEHQGEGDDKPPGDPDHEFDDDDSFDPPPVPGGDETPGKGVTTVSTEAITLFANNIEKLYGPMDELIKDLEAVEFAPGALPASFVLKSDIAGDKGLVPGSVTFINQVRDALAQIVNSARSLASAYQNHEEFNKMTGKDLGEFISQLKGSINALGSETPAA